MSREDKVELGKVEAKPATEAEKRTIPDKSQFQAFMEKSPVSKEGAAPTGATPMELAKGVNMSSAGPSIDSLLAQVHSADGDLNDIRNKLKNNPKLKMKRQHQYLLRNKLEDANDHLRGAGQRLGADMPDLKPLPESANPIKRFIGYVTDGQNQLMAARAKLQEASKNPNNLNPADMLLVQIKLSQAQQELEYSSILLAKVVSAFKQMLNIQL